MQREVRYRRHTDEQDALLLAWVLILGVLGIGYPKLLTLASDTHGLNLSFPTPELEEKRQRRRKK